MVFIHIQTVVGLGISEASTVWGNKIRSEPKPATRVIPSRHLGHSKEQCSNGRAMASDQDSQVRTCPVQVAKFDENPNVKIYTPRKTNGWIPKSDGPWKMYVLSNLTWLFWVSMVYFRGVRWNWNFSCICRQGYFRGPGAQTFPIWRVGSPYKSRRHVQLSETVGWFRCRGFKQETSTQTGKNRIPPW